MAKSKNMRWFHRAFARAAQLTGRTDAVEQGVRLADGLAQSVSSQGAMPRRAALKTMGTLAALPLMSAGCSKERRLANARVAIIGGGLAGLTAAVRLKEMGVTPLLFEATERFGGRVRSIGGVLPEGKTFEAGGEFIDEDHTYMRSLAERYSLPLDDLDDTDLDGMRYAFNGAEVTTAELVEATAPYLPAFEADVAALEEDYASKSAQLDALTCAEYWDTMGIAGVCRAVLEAAVVSEFGREPAHVSALHFVEDLPGVEDGSTASDGAERYILRDGNQALVDAMVEELGGLNGEYMFRWHRLKRVWSDGSKLGFYCEGKAYRTVDAMLIAMPLKALADVEFTFDLPDRLTNYISNSVMGTHSKVIAGFDSTPWRDAGSNGDVLSDGPMQACWDSNPKKEGQGSLSFLIGGEPGANLPLNDVGGLVISYMNQLGPLQLGTDGTRNGIQWGINWAQEEGYTGSYTCLKPGQYTVVESLFFFDGDEDERQVPFLDNLAFIGESFSGDYWGYMEGAAQTGWMAAQHLIDEVL